MGEGVYHDEHGLTRLIAHKEWAHDENEDNSFDYAMLVQTTRANLPEAFSTCHEWRSDRRGVAVIARSKLFCVDLCEDSFGTIAATVRPRIDLSPERARYARLHLPRMASAVFLKLAAHYELRIRTTGYTTARAPENRAAAA